MKLALCTSAILLAVLACVFARDAREQARIDFLIRDVEQAKGAVFIRNGSEHPSAEAAKHLRMKLDYAGARVQTAEDFVKLCASESYLTHQRYKIRLAGGKTVDAGEYFTSRLREFDAQKQ
ncbi:MAG: DUF5329 family protein [Chthoniobacterales bacterium]